METLSSNGLSITLNNTILKKRVLITVFVLFMMFQSKYIRLNLTICMCYLKIFSFLLLFITHNFLF